MDERAGDPNRPWLLLRDQGYLRATPGEVVDYDVVETEIMAFAERFRVIEIAIDR